MDDIRLEAIEAIKSCAIARAQAKLVADECGEGSDDARIAREIARDAEETLAHALRTYIVSRPHPWADGVAYHGVAFFPRDWDGGCDGRARAYVESFDAEKPPPPGYGRVLDILQDDGRMDPGWLALEARQKAVDEIDREGEGWKTGKPDEWPGE